MENLPENYNNSNPENINNNKENPNQEKKVHGVDKDLL
jgi:hypothetical protein